MDNYDPVVELCGESLVFMVVSTCGNGDPPANGEAFVHELVDMINIDRENGTTDHLSNLRYDHMHILRT